MGLAMIRGPIPVQSLLSYLRPTRRYTMLEPATARMVWSLSERSAEIVSVAPGTGRALRATSLKGCFRAERILTTSLAITPPAPKRVIMCVVLSWRSTERFVLVPPKTYNLNDRMDLFRIPFVNQHKGR